MNNQSPIHFVIVAIVAIATWWLAESNDPVEIGGQINREQRQIDYFVHDLVTLEFGDDGLPARLLTTPELRYFLVDKSTELTQPHIETYRRNLPPWRIDAEQGWQSEDGKLVLLSGEVVAQRDESEDTEPLHLVTSNVRLKPKHDYFETDEGVVVTSHRDSISATGMQAWLKEPGRIKYLSKVKMHHAAID